MSTLGFDRGSGSRWNAADLTWNISPNANFAWGAQAFLFIACDNSAPGGTDPVVSVTDSLGNLWHLINSRTNSAGNVPNDGVCGKIYACSQNVDILTTSTVITVTFSTATAAKAYTLNEFRSTEANRSTSLIAHSLNSQTTDSPSAGAATVTSGVGIAGVCGRQDNAAPTSQDTDGTGGAVWSAGQVAFTSQGPATSDVSVISQWKVFVTTGGTQTFNLVYAISERSVVGWVEFSDPPLGTTSLSPATATLTLSGQNAEIFTPGGVEFLKAEIGQQISKTQKVAQ